MGRANKLHTAFCDGACCEGFEFTTDLIDDGTPVEDLGWYDPLIRDREKSFQLDEERAKYWISKGAKPSETVRSMLKLRGIRG